MNIAIKNITINNTIFTLTNQRAAFWKKEKHSFYLIFTLEKQLIFAKTELRWPIRL